MSKMKNSGIEWIGEIPVEWDIIRVKDAFFRKKEKAKQKEPTILSLARDSVKVRDISNNDGQLAADYSDYNPVSINDLLLNPMDLISGDNCNIAKVEGVISPAYFNLQSKNGINPEFYNFYFKYQYWCKAFFAHGKGVSYENRWTLNGDTLDRFPVLLPPITEQNRIADYLKKQNNRIDALKIDIKKQIEILEEYKKSIITRAVTKGLNQAVEMKDSGVEEIGKIPVHWKVERAKYVCDSLSKGNGITKEDVIEGGDIQCVRYGEIYSRYDAAFVQSISSTDLDRISSPKFISKGDILFAGTGELVEEIGKNIVYMGEERCLAGGDIIIMKHSQNPIFLNYAMNCSSSQAQKSKGKAKLKVVHASSTDIGNVYIALPPIKEQKEISDYLEPICEEINHAIEEKEKQIDILEEYKKTIIFEYVTGKKEVPSNA